ncbi:hypothetical protein QTO34_004256 [Cnephaeus nilssonii]|uniref:Uncharacterized protein n=1 Tax=Cnephaeus nilssonii TaxID=3371016 RepID=A0AA40LM38_CNENI|nr:hypothetical protein QTO34_004256 [Eptesicus nilssonii]
MACYYTESPGEPCFAAFLENQAAVKREPAFQVKMMLETQVTFCCKPPPEIPKMTQNRVPQMLQPVHSGHDTIGNSNRHKALNSRRQEIGTKRTGNKLLDTVPCKSL